MMDIIKKQGIGAWITLGTIVVALVGMIIYGVALATGDGVQVANGGEMFLEGKDFALSTTFGVLGLIFVAAALVLAQFEFEGLIGMICGMVVDALRIVAPALLIFALVELLNGTLTGLGWTFFSNEELEINPVAIDAGKLTITAMIFFIVSAVAGIVGSFFQMVKKEA